MGEPADQEDEIFGNAIRGALSDTLGQEDDEQPFEFLADEPDREGKTPYGKGKNLVALRRARAEVLDGGLSLDDFKITVEDILVNISRAVDLLELASVKKKEVTLPPDQAEVVAGTRQEMIKLEAGIESMLSYAGSQELGELEEGMAAVEEAMLALTQLQSRADELAQLEKAARSAPAEVELEERLG
jgi:hypothetical protein